MTLEEIQHEIILTLKQYNKSKTPKERRIFRELLETLYTLKENLIKDQHVDSINQCGNSTSIS
jgi:hypothetical protein